MDKPARGAKPRKRDSTKGFSACGLALAPSLVLPNFDTERNQANLDAAKAGREIAMVQYEQVSQSPIREVADARAGRDTLASQLLASQ